MARRPSPNHVAPTDKLARVSGGKRALGAFVDSVVQLRRAIYELQRSPNMSASGPTEPEILNYMIEKKWPTIGRDFDQAILRLVEWRKAESFGPTDRISETRYRLTHDGLVEEETIGQPGRRSMAWKVFNEIRKPTMLAGFFYTVVGILIGYLLRSP